MIAIGLPQPVFATRSLHAGDLDAGRNRCVCPGAQDGLWIGRIATLASPNSRLRLLLRKKGFTHAA